MGFLVKISSLFNIVAYLCGWETHREPYHIGNFIRRNGASIWKKSHIAWTVSDNKLGSVRSLHRKKQSRINVRAILNKYNNERKFSVHAENNPHVPTGISKLPIKWWPLFALLVCDTSIVFRKTRSVFCNTWLAGMSSSSWDVEMEILEVYLKAEDPSYNLLFNSLSYKSAVLGRESDIASRETRQFSRETWRISLRTIHVSFLSRISEPCSM